MKRRHHCRACGHVVCGNCSSQKAPLRYLRWESVRTCDTCFDQLYEGKAILLKSIISENVYVHIYFTMTFFLELGKDERFRGKFKKKEGNKTGLSIKKVSSLETESGRR